MIRRVIWAMVVVLVAAYFIYNYLENKSKEEREKAEAKRTEEAMKASLVELLKRTNAIYNWEETLSKGNYIRMAPIFTIELERLWIGARPILFFGAIKDVLDRDDENYMVIIEKHSLDLKYIFETDLILYLVCPKIKIDLLLKLYPDIYDQKYFKNSIAVVADIKSIETKLIPDNEGGTLDIKIGKGNCVDILYIGNNLFRKIQDQLSKEQ